jgi:putative sterol carrier protein
MSEFPSVKRLFPRKLTAAEVSSSDIAASMEAGARLLKRGKDVGRLEVRLIGKRGSNSYTFDVLGGECRMSKGSPAESDFEVVVSEETWVEIANGDLSPVDAYLTGRMELSGDLEFAKRQYAKAMARGSAEDLPF